jgi:hypothetical protein
MHVRQLLFDCPDEYFVEDLSRANARRLVDLDANDLRDTHSAKVGCVGAGTTAYVEHAPEWLGQKPEDIGSGIAVVGRILGSRRSRSIHAVNSTGHPYCCVSCSRP